MRRIIPVIAAASACSFGAALSIVACRGSSTPTAISAVSSDSTPNGAATSPHALSAGAVEVFQDKAAFQAALRTSSVRTVPQDLSQSGTNTGGGSYELQLGGVRIRIQGPAFYDTFSGVDVLSKGVPVTIFFPPGAQGGGVDIAQLAEVTVTTRGRAGESLVLDRFSNGGMGFLGFTAPSGIEAIELSDPNASDTTTPITNLAEFTFGEVGVDTLPLDCAVLGNRRPSVRVQVRGKEVTVTVTAHGVAVPAEVNVSPVIVGSVGRFRLWPNGRHQGPKVTTEVFPTLRPQDFPVDVELRYRYPANASPGEVLAGLDYELLSACFDDITGALEIGNIDEYGSCRPGERVILQCDRGLSYTID